MGERAIKFEEKIIKMDNNRFVKLCWNEKRNTGQIDDYSKERKVFFEKLDLSTEYVYNKLLNNEEISGEIYQKLLDTENKNIITAINNSNYNTRYKNIMNGSLPKYLKEYKLGRRIDILARLRCGNYDLGNKYWLEDKEKICKLCKKEKGSIEHLTYECEELKDLAKALREKPILKYEQIMNENGVIEVIKLYKQIEELYKNVTPGVGN